MRMQDFMQLLAALGAGSAVPTVGRNLWRRLRHDPKAEAEARKLNAEAQRIEWQTLHDEIRRLDSELSEVRDELAIVKKSAAHEKTELENENKRLRLEVSSLRRRVGQLEEIIKTKTTPEDMRAQLAEIDRKTKEPRK